MNGHEFKFSFPNLETYRRFRFCLYMTILDDSKKLTKSEAWKKWDGISNYDMTIRERQFLSFMVPKTTH